MSPSEEIETNEPWAKPEKDGARQRGPNGTGVPLGVGKDVGDAGSCGI